MDVPEVMINNQIDQMVQDFSMRMKYQGLPVEQYLQFTGQQWKISEKISVPMQSSR